MRRLASFFCFAILIAGTACGGSSLEAPACNVGTPTPACETSGDVGTVISIASGMAHTCALFSGGTIKCWGDNTYGQLGVGSGCLMNSAVPLTVSNICNAQAISAGDLHTCALIQDGTVACWGNGAGNIADQTSPMTIDAGSDQCETVASSGQPEKVGSKPGTVPCFGGAAHVASGNNLDCAVKGDGTVACWGLNPLPPDEVAGLQNVRATAVEGTSACALRQDGTVACWGANESGELGNPTLKFSSAPVDVQNLPRAIAITAGSTVSGTSKCPACYGYTCALISDGSVQCWGEDQNGELGNGATALVATPSPVTVVGLNNAVSIVGGEGHVFAIRADGTVAAWGANRCGELGDGTMNDATKPVTVQGLKQVTSVSSGACHACALSADGGVQCWGDGSDGELGNGDNASSLTPVRVTL